MRIVIIILSYALLVPTQLYAQDILRAEKQIFLPPEDVGIHDDFKAKGLYFKGFQYFPKLKSSLVSSSNLYATNNNQIEDLSLRLEPEIKILKNYKNLKLAANLNSKLERYQKTTEENIDDVNLSFSGLYDLNSRWSVPFSLTRNINSRERGEPLNNQSTEAPLRITKNSAQFGISRKFNRLTVSTLGKYQKTKFSDGISRIDNNPIIYRDNNSSTYGININTNYEFLRDRDGSAEHIAFLKLRFNNNKYKTRDFSNGSFSGASRDNKEYGFLAGFETSYKQLLFANIGAGYSINKFQDSDLEEIENFDLYANIEYPYTKKLMLGFDILRRIDQDNDILLGEKETLLSLSADYEVFSRLFVNSEASYTHSTVDSVDREDDTYRLGLKALYIFNQNLRSQIEYRLQKRYSNSPSNEFKQQTILLSLVNQL